MSCPLCDYISIVHSACIILCMNWILNVRHVIFWKQKLSVNRRKKCVHSLSLSLSDLDWASKYIWLTMITKGTLNIDLWVKGKRQVGCCPPVRPLTHCLIDRWKMSVASFVKSSSNEQVLLQQKWIRVIDHPV